MSRVEQAVDAGDAEPSLQVAADNQLALPAQEIVTGRGLVAGVSGAGKSNTATVVAEEVLSIGVPVVVLDPEGEFVALADEYPVVVFGEHTDAHANGDADAARSLAYRAVDERVPVVFDLSGFAEEEGERIAAAVANGLFHAEQESEIPLLFIADEIDEFLPESGKTVASKPLSRVAQRGRKRGLGILGVSQRPADVSKEFVTQAEHHVWHRLTWENDQDVAKKHLPNHYADVLESLDDGEVLLDASWRDDPSRFFFRFKTVADLGATPSIARSLGSVPAEIPQSLLDDEETEDASGECQNCPFCRAGVEPPAHVAAAVSDDEGDVLGVYRAQKLRNGSFRVELRENFLDDLGLEEGDTVGIGVEDGEVRFTPGKSRLVDVTVDPTGRVTLSGRALSFLAVDAGDHVRVVDYGDRVVLDRVTGRQDAVEYPVLGRVEPYCSKTADDRADSAQLPTAVPNYLGLDERLGVRHDEDGEVFLTDPADADVSYVIQDGCPTLGAKGLRPLDARDGDPITVRPVDPDRARVTVERGGQA